MLCNMSWAVSFARETRSDNESDFKISFPSKYNW